MLIDCFRGRPRTTSVDNSPLTPATDNSRGTPVLDIFHVDNDAFGRNAIVATRGYARRENSKQDDARLHDEDDESRATMAISDSGAADHAQNSSDNGEIEQGDEDVGNRGWAFRRFKLFGPWRWDRRRDWRNNRRGLMMLTASLKEREKEWEVERERKKAMEAQRAASERTQTQDSSASAMDMKPRSLSQIERTIERELLKDTTKGINWIRNREIGGFGSRGVGVSNDDFEARIEGKDLKNLGTGEYLEMDKHQTLIRSTIGIAFSHDEDFFASSHGDHTVKVWNYPDMSLYQVLEGHPRTPWTVKFHPFISRVIASGCLGKLCRVWDIEKGECLYQQSFSASISCISFHPRGSLIAVTSGRSVYLWDYVNPGRWRLLRHGEHPYHMVDFHPSGRYILTGEKNGLPNRADPNDSQFTLRLTLDHFDSTCGIIHADRPPLIIARAIAYNDAGTHFSPCGTMLVACIPLYSWKLSYQIAVMALPSHKERTGTILSHAPLDANHTLALTNLKFSATSTHLLAGYSFRRSNSILKRLDEEGAPVIDIYRLGKGFKSSAKIIKTIYAEVRRNTEEIPESVEDEINVALFAPGQGFSRGLIYGTQKGRIRVCTHECRAVPPYNASKKVDKKESLREVICSNEV